jgi:2-keto-4-pentenoate hydratase
MNSAAFQRSVGIDGPLVGRLVASGVVGSGGAYALGGAVNPLVEPEVAVLVGARGSVDAVAPALEIVDVDAPLAEIEVALTRNIFHRAVVFGEWLSPSRAVGGGTVDGEGEVVFESGVVVATGAVGDLASIVGYVSDYLAAFGEELRAGDRLITGTLAPPPSVRAGERVRFDAGALGSVGVAFTA